MKLSRLWRQQMYINPRVLEAQYAVRGLIPMRADEIKQELQKLKQHEQQQQHDKAGAAAAARKYAFDSLVYCNIGNPQALQQKPLTFFRQVMSLVDAPFVLDNAAITAQYPSDAVARARDFVAQMNHATGAYTDSMGLLCAREAVAAFINARDGHIAPAARADHICLTDGASTGVKMVMQLLIGGPADAMMYPIPQYPLYTAQLALLGGTSAPYFLHEREAWAVRDDELAQAYDACVQTHKATPRLFVCINPGNPTGNVMDRAVMETIVRFCHDRHMVLLADEVYQENVYDTRKSFTSFRAVVRGMPEPFRSGTALLSIHSTSKGFIGECGRRGGYAELVNFPDELLAQFKKLASINLCANINGQIMTALMCSPPRDGDASYASYWAEYAAIRDELCRRAQMVAKELNSIRGIECNAVEGAMYAFPRITVPEKYAAHNATQNAQEGRKLHVDARWALDLLERSGIVVVPGSGFGQEANTLHFRTTILPPTEQMQRMIDAIRSLQEELYSKYAE